LIAAICPPLRNSSSNYPQCCDPLSFTRRHLAQIAASCALLRRIALITGRLQQYPRKAANGGAADIGRRG
jgi:hypothetical protein